MGFKINDFVNVSINYKKDADNQLQFGTTTLLWDKSKQKYDIDYILAGNGTTKNEILSQCLTTEEISSEAKKEYNFITRQFVRFVTLYFANGGAELQVITVDGLGEAVTAIKELPSEEIIITSNFDSAAMLDIREKVVDDEIGNTIDSKLFITHDSNLSVVDGISDLSNFAIIYDYKDSVDVNTGKLDGVTMSNGLEMAIAAYLSSINSYKVDSVKDVMFTPVVVADSMLPDVSNYNENYLYRTNFVANIPSLSGDNSGLFILGGNGVNGISIVNQFELIILHNIITNDLFNFLLTKPKYNANSISNAISIINNDLSLFVNNGYIETNATWTAEDLTDFDGNVLIKTGDPLPKGYRVFVGPITSYDREQGILPTFYVALADTSGVRYINISGRAI